MSKMSKLDRDWGMIIAWSSIALLFIMFLVMVFAGLDQIDRRVCGTASPAKYVELNCADVEGK